MRAIVLGSLRGVQRLDSSRSYPLALHPVGDDRSVLDHLLAALAARGIDDVVFVGGYHIEKVVDAYPGLRFYHHPGWAQEGEVEALAAAAAELTGPLIVCRTDVVLDAAVLAAALAPVSGEGPVERAEAPVALAIATHRRSSRERRLPANLPRVLAQDGTLLRIDDRIPSSSADRCFIGLLAASAAGSPLLAAQVHKLAAAGSSHSLVDLIHGLQDGGLRGGEASPGRPGLAAASAAVASIAVADVPDGWLSVDKEGVHGRFTFGTKAETLDRLRPQLRAARIPQQIVFTEHDWNDDSEAVLARLRSALPTGEWAVRSSALSEDTEASSQAGRFDSVLGVPAGDCQALRRAIEQVLRSFADAGCADPLNQVFVQPMVADVALSGVLFTRDLASRAPYLVINYDGRSTRTDTVTSGAGGQTTILYKYAPRALTDPRLQPLLDVSLELQDVIHDDALDIEFAIDTSGQCHLLQVRPIATVRERDAPTDEDFDAELEAVAQFVTTLMRRRPLLVGDSTVLGTMPDWNPAEIVGTHPRPLALSLYQTLITDHEWARSRALLGYRDTYPEPLIVSLAGAPYVDVRVSFNSFLPAGVSDATADKLVDAYLDRLRAAPWLHDKVEFEVALTCFVLDFDSAAVGLRDAGLNPQELRELETGLRALTDDLVRGRVEPILSLEAQLDQLAVRRRRLLDQSLDGVGALAGAVHSLIHDCRRYGTVPFSSLARYAFVAKLLLRSLSNLGVLSADEYEAVLADIPTVASDIAEDLAALGRGELKQATFLERYGHLRPGTYDLLSPSYAERPDLYLGGLTASESAAAPQAGRARGILEAKSPAIQRALQAAGMQATAAELGGFVLASIPGRERAKFEFSKNLSAALSLLGRLGDALGISRDELTFLPVERLLRLRTESPSPSLRLEFKQLSGLNRKRHTLSKALRLPHLITGPGDVLCFDQQEWQPNFITHENVVAPVVELDGATESGSLDGKIVLIRSADPGYDWIFGHSIAGLITEFGGVASHMAIRAAEFGLPAAIGCGEVQYARARRARVIALECGSRQIRVVE